MSNINGKVYAMNVVTPMKPWKTPLLRLIFFLLGHWKAKQQDLINLSFIEFARWVIIPRTKFPRPDGSRPAEQLKYDYLLFFSNFNGTWNQYIDAFSAVLSTGLNLIWRWGEKFPGGLINRRRITRRGLPYGDYVPAGEPVSDADDRGMIFMALNASLSRQFEFVQQQWIEYGNDSHLGNDKDPMLGNHGGLGKFAIQGDETPGNPPFVCSHLPQFVELRGGDYFFLPSITALGMIARGLVDPR